MKVTMVSCQETLSGIGRYSLELLHHMRLIYPETRLFIPETKQDVSVKGSVSYKTRSFRNLRPYILPYYINLGLKSERSELFHAHWFISGLALTYRPKSPYIITIHDVSLLHVSENESRLYRYYYRWALRRFKELNTPLIVCSESAKKDALLHADYPEHLVHVIYNGINHAQFYQLPPRPSDKFRIIYSGGLGKRKQVDLLLSAYQIVESRYKNVELWIAGAYPERTVYPQIAESLGLKNVLFTGYIPDDQMNNFYNSGDLFVFTSKYEGFGFSPLEAMAAGLPVISTTGGALAETTKDAALHVQQDPRDIADKIMHMLVNREERDKWRSKGLERVKNFTWEKTAEQTNKLYMALL